MSLTSCASCGTRLSGAVRRCGGCEAPHHEPCAALAPSCGACGGELAGPHEGRRLPRLGALARLIERRGGLSAPEGACAVTLLPAARRAREQAEAAQAVAEVLGATFDEGRLHLAADHPEPLVRVDAAAEAEALVGALERAGLTAASVPLGALLAPLAAFEADAVTVGPPLGCRRGDEVRVLAEGAPRLVVSAQLVRVERGAAPGPGRPERRRVEPIGLVFEPGAAEPVLLSARLMRELPGASSLSQRLAALLERLAAGGTLCLLEGDKSPTLLTPSGEGAWHDNRPSLLLATRLLAR